MGKQQDFDDFVNRLKTASKSDKPSKSPVPRPCLSLSPHYDERL